MSSKQLEVQFEDPNPQKWCHPLKEDVLAEKAGSIFSPSLFGKFFDPSDAFPLWEFTSDELLPVSTSSAHRGVDWFQTDADFLLKADLHGHGGVQVSVENGKILEISGQRKENQKRNWKSGRWWEHGFVRRVELPEIADWRRTEACIKSDSFLEIRIPKIPRDSDAPQQN